MKKIFFFWVQEKIIKERKQPVLQWILKFFSFFFRFVIFIKNFLYDHGFIKVVKVNRWIVSVGNITAGGSGKTPVILFLAEKLNANFSVLIRGYGSKIKNFSIVEDRSYWQEVGDEALLLKRRGSMEVIVGKNRVLTAEKTKNNLVILDDGFQYRRLFRDLDIVVIDGLDPFGYGDFLPHGLLRDSPKRLKTAHFLIVNNVFDEEQYQRVTKRLRVYNETAPILAFTPEIEGFYSLKGEKYKDVRKVGLFCAIAHPEYFVRLLKQKKIEILDTLFYFDHSYFEKDILEKFWQKTKGKNANVLVCSEKDSVKLNKSISTPIVFAKMHLKPFKNDNMEKLIETLNRHVII